MPAKNVKLNAVEIKAKKRLDELKYKYHLSYSTIINIIAEKYYLLIPNVLEEKYLYDKKGTKTSIKPRHSEQYKKPSFVMTNAIMIFAYKDLEKYSKNVKQREKVNNFIYEELNNTYEDNWDGNRMNRILPKIVKANKEYYRKMLEE